MNDRGIQLAIIATGVGAMAPAGRTGEREAERREMEKQKATNPRHRLAWA